MIQLTCYKSHSVKLDEVSVTPETQATTQEHKKQGSMTILMEQKNPPKIEVKAKEIHETSEREFKIRILRKFSELQENTTR
jgi:hypothetical protein